MNCYTYGEDEGNKGPNNVASLLMQDLHSRGWLQDDDPSPSLTIIFDKCGGQNKNNVVLIILAYLFERGFFLEGPFCVMSVGIQKMHVIGLSISSRFDTTNKIFTP
jgi:hypothetical protein